MSEFYVYAHKRLSSGATFYVGKGRGRRAYSMSSRNAHWKNVVAKDGGRDVEFIVTGVDEELAFLVEMESIDQHRRLGARLVNLTDGGDGVSGYRNPNGAPNKGIPCSEEMRARISATLKAKGCLPPIGWNKGKKSSPEHLEKMSAGMMKAWAKAKEDGSRAVSDETRAKQSKARLGHVNSEETRRKLSVALKANKYIRTRPDMTGFVHSAETRAKMSEAMKGRKPHNRKSVRCVNTGEVFESATAAAKHLGRKEHTLIAACCNGSVKSAYGLKFEYING